LKKDNNREYLGREMILDIAAAAAVPNSSMSEASAG